MMAFSQISEQAYDEAAGNIVYAKLIPFLVKDFVTRIDSSLMMKANNLPAKTTVAVTPGQAIAGTGGAGPVTGSTVSPGSGSGNGAVTPILDGSVPHPQTQQLIAYWKAVEDAGGVATAAVLETALGQ